MSEETTYIGKLTHQIKLMGQLARGTPEGPAAHSDLKVINPHANPLPFYFTVRAADADLFQQEAAMGKGHLALVVADKIYSDIGILQQNWDYWLT